MGAPELSRIACVGLGDTKTESTRAGSLGGGNVEGSFQWTPAVHALTILLAKVAVWRSDGGRFLEDFGANEPLLEGEASTPASSLDYAVGKVPNWMGQMFGFDEAGVPFVRTLFTRVNAERKRSGPVVLRLSQKSFTSLQVDLFHEGKLVQEYAQLRVLVEQLIANWRSPKEILAQAFSKESPGEAPQIASARVRKPEVTDVSLQGQVQRKYQQIWESEGSDEQKVGLTAAILGELWGHRLLYLSFDVHVEILNASGDAQIRWDVNVANISCETLCGMVHESCFDFEGDAKRVALQAFDEHGNPLAVSNLSQVEHQHYFFCHFPRPLLPKEIFKYSYGAWVPGLFSRGMSPNSHHWDVRINKPMLRTSLTVLHRKGRAFKGCQLMRAVNGEFVTLPDPELEGDSDNKEVRLFWSKRFPRIGEFYRTYWEYFPENASREANG